jgi:hypothetical protein
MRQNKNWAKPTNLMWIFGKPTNLRVERDRLSCVVTRKLLHLVKNTDLMITF